MTDRILVVDPDESLRDALMLALSPESYEVTGVASCGAALVMLESRPFELVLCELGRLGKCYTGHLLVAPWVFERLFRPCLGSPVEAAVSRSPLDQFAE